MTTSKCFFVHSERCNWVAHSDRRCSPFCCCSTEIPCSPLVFLWSRLLFILFFRPGPRSGNRVWFGLSLLGSLSRPVWSMFAATPGKTQNKTWRSSVQRLSLWRVIIFYVRTFRHILQRVIQFVKDLPVCPCSTRCLVRLIYRKIHTVLLGLRKCPLRMYKAHHTQPFSSRSIKQKQSCVWMPVNEWVWNENKATRHASLHEAVERKPILSATFINRHSVAALVRPKWSEFPHPIPQHFPKVSIKRMRCLPRSALVSLWWPWPGPAAKETLNSNDLESSEAVPGRCERTEVRNYKLLSFFTSQECENWMHNPNHCEQGGMHQWQPTRPKQFSCSRLHLCQKRTFFYWTVLKTSDDNTHCSESEIVQANQICTKCIRCCRQSGRNYYSTATHKNSKIVGSIYLEPHRNSVLYRFTQYCRRRGSHAGLSCQQVGLTFYGKWLWLL